MSTTSCEAVVGQFDAATWERFVGCSTGHAQHRSSRGTRSGDLRVARRCRRADDPTVELAMTKKRPRDVNSLAKQDHVWTLSEIAGLLD
jgi:hypothetical protein